MFNIDQLRLVERESKFRFPDAFWAFADEFNAIAGAPNFSDVFAQAHFATRQDVDKAWELGLSKSQAPFFCELQPAHTDYYCCGRNGEENEQAVVVFADHAVVSDWPSF